MDVNRLFGLQGKTAIVTGASRGIGFALAQGLAAAGAAVTGIARSAAPAKPFGPGVGYVSADVSGDLAAIFARAAGERGVIDVLVNAAGISLAAVEDDAARRADFARTLEVNVAGPYACCLAVLPFMQSGGSIINVTSIGSVTGFPGNPGYAASKGGLRIMTKALALDYGKAGIRVNALAPGYIRTEMTAGSFADPERHAQRRRHTCLDRWGEVEDLVGAVIFLASDASAYVTGVDLFVDGGWTAKGMV